METMVEIADAAPSRGRSGGRGRRPLNPDAATCDFRAVLNAVIRIAPRLRTQIKAGLSALLEEIDRKDSTIKDYLRGKATYPHGLPERIICLTNLGSEGMVPDDFKTPGRFLAMLRPESSGPAGSDSMTKLMGRWRKRPGSLLVSVEERKATKLLRTVDPKSAPEYLPGSYWLSLTPEPESPPFRLLLLEHDVTRSEWLCMNKYEICNLDIRTANRHRRVAFEIGHATGRCTIYAVASEAPFGHAIEHLVEHLIPESTVFTGPQVHVLASELDKIDLVKPLTTASFTYEVTATR